MSRFIGVTASNDQHAYDARCDELNDEFEDERTETMGSPPSRAARYMALFDAAAEASVWLDVLEYSNPGATDAFVHWAESRDLDVTIALSARAATVSYSVAVNSGRICVFVAERP